MRIFLIWNRNYKTQCVIAEDAQQALQLSMDSGHFKKPRGYRRFVDMTDVADEAKNPKALRKLLKAGVPGVVDHTEERGWHIRNT